MTDQLAGFRDKLYWRRDPTIIAEKWHCLKKTRLADGRTLFVSLCGRYEQNVSGGQAITRPAVHLRCGLCDGSEMQRRGWQESGPER